MTEDTNILRDPSTYQTLKSPGNIESERREIRSCESERRADMPADEREKSRPLTMGFGFAMMRPRSTRSRR
jgi:hypothetical protein